MAAGMWGTSNSLISGGAPASQVQAGADLDEVQTEALGFLGLSGDAKVRLLSTPWPTDALPKSTSSLLSIASRAGLFAAAAPDALVLGKTDDVRAAFTKDGPSQNNIKLYQPTLTLPVPRVSQVVFSSDEKYLLICAEAGGGLQGYETESLLKGNTQHAFQMGTESIGVRSLAPNPVEGHIFALVLEDGKLMLANLQSKSYGTTVNGNPLLRERGVSCVSWSAKGKQLVAGLDDGTAVQLTPDGTLKAAIPKPPQLTASAHVSSLIWLDNNSFLMVYNPNDIDPSQAPDSAYFLITRQEQQFNAQKFALDPCPPFGINCSPPHQYLMRLRNWEPSLKDTLIIASTCSADIGLVANSATPLSADLPNGLNVYSAMLLEDTRRAQLPIGEIGDMPGDTSPIGMAIDLSSNEPVRRPIPKEEELDASRTPVPAVMVLNNEGVLSAWWYIYNDSVMQSKPYHGLVAAGSAAPTPTSATGPPGQSLPTFGTSSRPSSLTAAPALGSSSPWSSTPTGSMTTQPGGAKFGQTSFGQPPTPAFGKPSFGTPSAPNAGGAKPFGGALGATGSPWGQPSANNDSAKPPAFSSFASPAARSASPFSSINNTSQTPAFGAPEKPAATSPFGSLGSKTETSLFGAPKQNEAPKPATSSFGTGGTPQTAWGFGNLGAKPTEGAAPNQQPSFGSTVTLGSTVPSMGQAPSTLGSGKSLFGTPPLSNNTSDGIKQPAAKPLNADIDMSMDKSESIFGGGLGGLSLGYGATKQTQEPKIKQESPEPAPLPPDPSRIKSVAQSPKTKTVEAEDAPLPPDPTSTKTSKPEEAPLPPDPTTSKPEEPEASFSPLKPEPAPLPPSPKSAPQAERSQSETPLDTPRRPSTAQKQADSTQLPASPSDKSRSLSSAKSTTPPVDMRTGPKDGSDHELHSPVGSEPVDLGEVGNTPPSPTKSILPEDETTEPNMRNVTWPRSKGMPNWGLNQGSSAVPPKSPGQEPSTPSVFSPDSTRSIKKPGYPSYDSPLQVQPPVVFQPPAVPQSPRSPSPVRDQQYPPNRPRLSTRRSGQSPLRSGGLSPDRHRSIPPGISVAPTRPKEQQDLAASTQSMRESTRNRSSIRSPNEELVDEESEDEAALTRETLEKPFEPSRTLGDFLAHQDYVGRISSHGLASQIERVYRDIDSMVDTLGFNARTLGSFIKGHSEGYKEDGRTREDLYPDHWDEWVLVELTDLGAVLKELTERLSSGRPQDVRTTLETCRNILQKTNQSRIVQADLSQQLKALRPKDHDNVESESDDDDTLNPASLPNFNHSTSSSSSSHHRQRQSPNRPRLTYAQSHALTSLRAAYTKAQQQLAQAEDAASLLRAKLAYVAPKTSLGSPTHQQSVPTVEAITATIAKMTRMAEHKRTDLDMVEAQLKAMLRQQKIASAGADDAFGLGSLNLGRNAGSQSPRDSPLASRGSASAGPGGVKSKLGQSQREKQKRAEKEQSPGTFSVPNDSSSEDGNEANEAENDSAYESAASSHTPRNRGRIPGAIDDSDDDDDAATDAEINALRETLRTKLKRARQVAPGVMKVGHKEKRSWAEREGRALRLLDGLRDAVVEVRAREGGADGGGEEVVIKNEDE